MCLVDERKCAISCEMRAASADQKCSTKQTTTWPINVCSKYLAHVVPGGAKVQLDELIQYLTLASILLAGSPHYHHDTNKASVGRRKGIKHFAGRHVNLADDKFQSATGKICDLEQRSNNPTINLKRNHDTRTDNYPGAGKKSTIVKLNSSDSNKKIFLCLVLIVTSFRLNHAPSCFGLGDFEFNNYNPYNNYVSITS